jgi:hypothetical protein
MFSLLGARLPIERDELDFQLATFKWLIGQFGPVEQPLVAPTPRFFSPEALSGRAGARAIFDEVRALAGMADWPCELRAGDANRPTDAGNAHLLRHEGAPPPCGTFEVGEGLAGRHGIITYNPSMERDPAGLVATFAHELGHYLMATAASDPPGGWDLHELHTDLTAVYLGFGLFMANNARSFAHFSTAGGSGWQAQWRGYLSEGALVTATAIFQRLAGREPGDAEPHLKDYLRKELRRADRALGKLAPDMAATVGTVDLDEYSGG